jgi:hypothetical protein
LRKHSRKDRHAVVRRSRFSEIYSLLPISFRLCPFGWIEPLFVLVYPYPSFLAVARELGENKGWLHTSKDRKCCDWMEMVQLKGLQRLCSLCSRTIGHQPRLKLDLPIQVPNRRNTMNTSQVCGLLVGVWRLMDDELI